MWMGFDRLASSYDTAFAERPVARILRARTHERIAAQLTPGMRALDIGCGTGIDAAWMAGRGAIVTALDSSGAMLDRARSRIGAQVPVTLVQADLNALRQSAPSGPYDLVLANFRGAQRSQRSRHGGRVAGGLCAIRGMGGHGGHVTLLRVGDAVAGRSPASARGDAAVGRACRFPGASPCSIRLNARSSAP
ncbi:MAG: class I SAM-dependent methyltransferase [Chloroflexi bacterium]|nr:class I SAM-dependent methyltransferase [Chloroflexota bacterium]